MRHRFVLALLLLFVFISGCAREKEEVISSFPSGAKKQTGIFRGEKPNRAQLKAFEYYESGERKKEFGFKDNHFFGPWTFWYKDGKKAAEGIIEVKALDHQNAVGTGTYFWPGGAKMIELKPKPDKSGSDVVAIYDESGKAYTAQNKPPELAAKIKTLLEKWE